MTAETTPQHQDPEDTNSDEFQQILQPEHERTAEEFLAWIDTEVRPRPEYAELSVLGINNTEDSSNFFAPLNDDWFVAEDEGDEEIRELFIQMDKETQAASAVETAVYASVSGNNLELVNDCFQEIVKEAKLRGAELDSVSYPQQSPIKKILQDPSNVVNLGISTEAVEARKDIPSFLGSVIIVFK